MTKDVAHQNQDHLIDFVIAWVDGDDTEIRDKREAYLASSEPHLGAKPTRFKSLDEIYYCLLSMQRFAPWVNKIYIVTDGQRPHAIAQIAKIDKAFASKIKLVDHKDIFSGYEESLPVFNSLSIETMLWRISGLSERFVYFNDDFLLAAPASPQDFFDGEKVVYRGRYMGAWYGAVIALKKLGWALKRAPHDKRRASFKDAQFHADRAMGGRGRFFVMGHTPYPARVSTLKACFKMRPELLRENIHHRFRDARQLNTFSLGLAAEMKEGGEFLIEKSDAVFIRGGDDRPERVREKLQELLSGDYLFACINSLDEAEPEVQKDVLDALDAYYS